MNAFRLAFKTYQVEDVDKMLKAVAGSGARIGTDKTAIELENALLQLGFAVFPSPSESVDGYFRVFRAGSLIHRFLTAFRTPGPNGDTDLANLLNKLKGGRQGGSTESDDLPD